MSSLIEFEKLNFSTIFHICLRILCMPKLTKLSNSDFVKNALREIVGYTRVQWLNFSLILV